MDELPKILIRTTSGKHCRVEFEGNGHSLAAKITWEGHEATPEDHAEVEAALMLVIEPMLGPGANVFTADMGHDKTARDAAVQKFLKASDN